MFLLKHVIYKKCTKSSNNKVAAYLFQNYVVLTKSQSSPEAVVVVAVDEPHTLVVVLVDDVIKLPEVQRGDVGRVSARQAGREVQHQHGALG